MYVYGNEDLLWSNHEDFDRLYYVFYTNTYLIKKSKMKKEKKRSIGGGR